MSTEDATYERLNGFVVRVLEFMRTNHGDPIFEQYLSAVNKPLSSRQMSMVISDLVEWMQDVSGEELSVLDGQLSEEGLPTLSLMRDRKDRVFGTILSQGNITSDDEYRIIAARLSDMGKPLPESDRALANRIIEQYESRKTV